MRVDTASSYCDCRLGGSIYFWVFFSFAVRKWLENLSQPAGDLRRPFVYHQILMLKLQRQGQDLKDWPRSLEEVAVRIKLWILSTCDSQWGPGALVMMVAQGWVSESLMGEATKATLIDSL